MVWEGMVLLRLWGRSLATPLRLGAVRLVRTALIADGGLPHSHACQQHPPHAGRLGSRRRVQTSPFPAPILHTGQMLLRRSPLMKQPRPWVLADCLGRIHGGTASYPCAAVVCPWQLPSSAET